MKIDQLKNIFVSCFFIILLLIGISSFYDYGISWDEPQQRIIGGASVKYIGEKFAPILLTRSVKEYPNLGEFADQDYGVAFEAPAIMMEQLFKLKYSHGVFAFRHLLTFLFFIGGVFAVYKLASRRFNSWQIGLLAATFLVISPRFFAEGFYNSKDIVFMSVFAIAMSTMFWFVAKPNIKTVLCHALATAYAVDVRIMAVILFLGTIFILCVKYIKKEIGLRRFLGVLCIYIPTTIVFVIMFFPYLWAHPIDNLVQIFMNMSKFNRWGGENLYNGDFIIGSKLPWHYSLVWILITTPILYLGLFMIGAVSTIRQLISRRLNPWSNDCQMQDMVFLVLFTTPILAVIFLDSILYNGWRQLYFVYPALLLLAVKGWVEIWNSRSFTYYARGLLVIITAVLLLLTVRWMIVNHPMQNLFFNSFAGHDLRSKWDMDYWGLGNKKALDFILSNDSSDIIYIKADSLTPIGHSLLMLPEEKRNRIKPVYKLGNYKPLYVLTNYYNTWLVDDLKYITEYDLFYQGKIDKEIYLSVYKKR